MRYNNEILEYFDVHSLLKNIFGKSQHAKRVESIANAALGIIASGSLIIHRIGRGLAEVCNLCDKHAVKQVDRLLSNTRLNVSDANLRWVPFVIGSRKTIKVTMDWTEFKKDKQATIALNLVTSHGRATPLLFKTVSTKTLKNNRNRHEDELLSKLRDLIPDDVSVTILADRGFCDIRLMDFIENDLGFQYVIRIRGNIKVEGKNKEQRSAKEWVGSSGRTKTLRNAKITAESYTVKTVVCTQAKMMKEPWCIVSSDASISGSGLVKWYSKRWGCEPQFRDTKDIHFGMGLSATHIGCTARRDRLLFINAIASVILNLLGAAGEKIGLDKYLKVNTVKHRTLSLFKQGCIYFKRISRMATDTLKELIREFYFLIKNQKCLTEILGVI